jgi:hypothetical protein
MSAKNALIIFGTIESIAEDTYVIRDSDGDRFTVNKPEHLRGSKQSEGFNNGLTCNYVYNAEATQRTAHAEASGFEDENHIVNPPYSASSPILALSYDGGQTWLDLNIDARHWIAVRSQPDLVLSRT